MSIPPLNDTGKNAQLNAKVALSNEKQRMAAIKIPPALLQRYVAAFPRYTSYPTAPQFSEQYSADDYRQLAKHSNEILMPRNLSLYVHVPFCHSLCYFCGCNKVITQAGNTKVNQYVENLLHEIDLRSALFDDDRRLSQIHFGGGTPNFLSESQLAEIVERIASRFRLDLPSRLEVGIEIDPRSIDGNGISQLADIGFNRFSIGVQDFANNVQRAVNRVQDEGKTLEVIAAACEVSDSVNVDLITGLPLQTSKSFAHTLERVVDAGVSRIAAYNFAYLPERIKAQKLINPNEIPSVEQRMEIVEITRATLLDAGYLHIGMDHFALPSDSLAQALQNNTLQRNFQGYTTNATTDLIGVGASAISQFKYSFAQNHTQLSNYNSAIAAGQLPIARGVTLDKDDVLRAHIIQEIMCRNSIDLLRNTWDIVETSEKVTLADYFSAELASLERCIEDGLLEISSNSMEITPLGAYFRRQMASQFDAYLPTNTHIPRSFRSKHANPSCQKSKNVVKFSQAL